MQKYSQIQIWKIIYILYSILQAKLWMINEIITFLNCLQHFSVKLHLKSCLSKKKISISKPFKDKINSKLKVIWNLEQKQWLLYSVLLCVFQFPPNQFHFPPLLIQTEKGQTTKNWLSWVSHAMYSVTCQCHLSIWLQA